MMPDVYILCYDNANNFIFGSHRTDVDIRDVKKHFVWRNILILAVLALGYIFFPRHVQQIALLIVFSAISLVTVKTIGIETVTAFSIFLGYVYGWFSGVFFGLVLGTYIWAQAGLNQKTLVQCLMNGLSGLLGYYAATLGFGFFWGYIAAAMARNIITSGIFLLINPDMINNITHFFSDVVWNTLIMSQILLLLYNLLMLISV